MKLTAFLFLVVALSLSASAFSQDAKQKATSQPASDTDAARLAHLDVLLENLRQELKIPALSAAIVKDQKVIWAKGFGYADLENKIPATEHTSYHLASLTKTFASTILMQLIQEGKVNLDDPVSKYGIAIESNGVIRVKHLFSHTSEGNPGEQYSYNGNRFAELDKVIEKATGKSFAELLIANILDPLDMNETAPNVPNILKTKSPAGTDQKTEDEVKAALTSLLAGFSAGNVEQIEKYFTPELNSFPRDGGLMTAFADLARLRGWYRSGLKLTFDIHDLEAAVYGNTALTTCIINGTVSFPGDPVRKEGPWRASYIWNNQSGMWKLVHTHESSLEGNVLTEKHKQRFDAVSKTLAQPYALDKSNIVKSAYPTNFSTSAGLISSVLDMAKYDIAIDRNRFLKKETQQLAFTPTVSTKGQTLPYGLGWFTQNYKGTRLIWHYGYWTCNSSLILKVPDRNITFIVMANTDNLSRPTDLGAGDVTSSPVGLAFLKTFIFPEVFGESLPDVNWNAPAQQLKDQLMQMTGKAYADLYAKELIVQSRVFSSVGKRDDTSRLFKVYGEMYLKSLPDDLSKKTAVAEIIRVKDDENKTVEFTLPRTQGVRVFAIGEGQAEAMFDYGWIESAEDGKVVWEMKAQSTAHAGGAGKNRKVDTVITLPAGKYKLRYKSDDSHSFDNWNSLPPEINFWGIALYAQEG